MDDFLLLRFRDMLQDTVEQHNEIARKSKNNRVLWGWWKKETEPFPDPFLSTLSEELESHGHNSSSMVYFINSGRKKLYRAELYRVHYDPSQEAFRPGEANELCPEYYRNTLLCAWFEVGELQEINAESLEDFVFSTRNSTFNGNGLSAISKSRIGQPIDTTDFDFLEDNVSLWFICKKTNLSPTSIRSFPNIFHKSYLTRGHYILHLSDLHFGAQHAYAIPNAKNNIVGKQTLLDSMCRDLAVQNISPSEIALVLITGDLTCTANAQEFNEAVRFIEEIKRRFGLGAGQIVCVPGNHDIEWISKDGILNEDAELNYRNFSRNIYNCEAEASLIRINEFLIDGKKIAVFGLNSCRVESRETAGIGYVGTEQIQLIEDFNRKCHDLDYKIALLHHHLLPVNYTEAYSSKQKEVSILLDAEALMQSLISNGIQTVLHGHQHQPYFSQIRRLIPSGVAGHANGVDGCLNVIGGGSVGTDHSHLNSIGRNTYHILRIEEDDAGYKIHVTLRIRNSDGAGYISGWEITL